MFLVQGVLAEKLYGRKWEALVKEKIFDPLGMNSSDFSVNDLQKNSDFSYGYREHKDSVLKMDYMNIDPIGPAGSINSNARDMSKWLMTWINAENMKAKKSFQHLMLRKPFHRKWPLDLQFLLKKFPM
jgi:CubicO group peptidase (beta-lactamase class C family)